MKRRIMFLSGAVAALTAVARGAPRRAAKRVVSSPEFPKPLGPYSHAVVSGGFVFVAGQAPINTSPEIAAGALEGNEHMIRKLRSGEYRLYSRKKNLKSGARRNLGTFKTRQQAEQHERAIQFFKRH